MPIHHGFRLPRRQQRDRQRTGRVFPSLDDPGYWHIPNFNPKEPGA